MRLLMASLSSIFCVAITLVVLPASAHSQAPEEIPGAKLLDRRAMQEICETPAAINIDPNGHFQCTVCPSDTDFHGNRESFGLLSVYQGHFSTTAQQQLLVVMMGCESHASGFGGSVLLTRFGLLWKKSAYFRADKPRKCFSFKARDGFDLLVCLQGDQHYDGYATWISAVSYKAHSLHAEPLLEVSGNAGLGSPKAGYCYGQEITAFEELPSGGGLRVEVKQARGLAPSSEKSCGETEIPMEPTETVSLHFQFDGDRFAVAPESKDSLRKVENFVPNQ